MREDQSVNLQPINSNRLSNQWASVTHMYLSTSVARLQECLIMPRFFMGSGTLSSGPHTCIISILLTEPFLWPTFFFYTFKSLKLYLLSVINLFFLIFNFFYFITFQPQLSTLFPNPQSSSLPPQLLPAKLSPLLFTGKSSHEEKT